MAKGIEGKKQGKKQPMKTMKEKRAEKKAKKAARGYLGPHLPGNTGWRYFTFRIFATRSNGCSPAWRDRRRAPDRFGARVRPRRRDRARPTPGRAP